MDKLNRGKFDGFRFVLTVTVFIFLLAGLVLFCVNFYGKMKSSAYSLYLTEYKALIKNELILTDNIIGIKRNNMKFEELKTEHDSLKEWKDKIDGHINSCLGEDNSEYRNYYNDTNELNDLLDEALIRIEKKQDLEKIIERLIDKKLSEF